MEKRLGADLSAVKIHTGGDSAAVASSIGAKAFTVGQDVHFNAGQFAPGTREGDRLLAHELTHVVQGRDAGIQRKPEAGEEIPDDNAVSEPHEPAEQEADAVADDVANDLHSPESETKEKLHTPRAEKQAKISAKLEGGVPRIFRAPMTPATPPPATPGTPSTAPASRPLDAASARAAIKAKAPDCDDIAEPLATEWIGKDETEFQTTFSDVNGLRNAVIKKFIGAGGPKEQTQIVGRPDPVAVQKFQDIDSEQHLDPAHGDLKTAFYTKLAAEMQKPTFTQRDRTYYAMTQAAGYAFNCKGKKIPVDRISPYSSRNTPVDRLYDLNKIQTDILAEIASSMPGCSPEEIDEAQKDDNLKKKAYRHILKKGRPPLDTIDKTKPISNFASWYKPGEIVVNTSAPPNQEFARMMTLGALQPEWYSNGTVVLNIERKLAAASRTLLKPTAFDGLMSALWCARNLGADDYGVTGGGIGEFLEAGVTFEEVTSATPVIPDDDFLLDLQRVKTQVANKFGKASTPTEERVRGNFGNTSIANTTRGKEGGGVAEMYDQVIGRSTQEQNSPSATPEAPGAAQPTSSLMPSGPAVAAGGAYDMTNGPRGAR
jgi:hypothetical protein